MNAIETLKNQLEQRIIGQQPLIERLLIGILSGGHLLIEGLPGLAKTSAVQALASGLDLSFKRLQFTPDLIPGDITGSDIFLPQEGQFRFIEGPLFSDIILADEINRAPPKVQSALLEAMQEQQITVGGTTRPLSRCFTVIATQNPIEHEGTYPLPEAQLDRFFMKILVDYPSADDELAIMRLEKRRLAKDEPITPASKDNTAVMSAEQLLEARREVNKIYIDKMLERYIISLVRATRSNDDSDIELRDLISRGASPRASLALAQAARAYAWLKGRDFVEPTDIGAMVNDVMRHRIVLSFTARSNGISPDELIDRISARVVIP